VVSVIAARPGTTVPMSDSSLEIEALIVQARSDVQVLGQLLDL
jgi:hypothetical protein